MCHMLLYTCEGVILSISRSLEAWKKDSLWCCVMTTPQNTRTPTHQWCPCSHIYIYIHSTAKQSHTKILLNFDHHDKWREGFEHGASITSPLVTWCFGWSVKTTLWEAVASSPLFWRIPRYSRPLAGWGKQKSMYPIFDAGLYSLAILATLVRQARSAHHDDW